MIVSFIIPAFKAGPTIGAALASIFAAPLPENWRLDVLVANDDSPDGAAQHAQVKTFPGVRYLSHSPNQGKCAAVNLAVPHSQGDVVIILDADDTLLADWTAGLSTILESWPIDAPLCFSACRTPAGESTVSDPDYTGPLTLHDMLNERHLGEYLPIFRGPALREAQGYRDPGDLYSCELWTYLGFAKRANLWISAEILRIYHTDRPGSVSSNLFSSQSAARMVHCYDLIFADFEALYQTHAPIHLGRRKLRQAVFAALAGQRGRAFQIWKNGARWRAPLETLGALVMIVIGPRATNALVGLAKKARILRRFG